MKNIENFDNCNNIKSKFSNKTIPKDRALNKGIVYKKKVLFGIFIILILGVSLSFVLAAKNNSDNLCKNYYWFDNQQHNKCNYKKFCGTFMYEGLRTFETINECSVALMEYNKNLINNTVKKMNYGQCVSNSTKQKNSCYKAVDFEYKSCKDLIKNESSTLNKTQIKERNKICVDNKKNGLKNCMSEFKLSKTDCVIYKCKDNEYFSNGTCIRNDTIEQNFCTLEQRNAEICPTLYKPVCGWINSSECPCRDIDDNLNLCATISCSKDFPNSCVACKDSTIEFWTKGECPRWIL